MRSNLDCWKTLQERGYFESHVHYKGYTIDGDEILPTIELFTRLVLHRKVVVIGCGYGRDVIQIAPHVEWVWGIDVSESLLQKASSLTRALWLYNFTGVLAEDYADHIPDDIDLVYSIVTMQHLTRDLVYQYFRVLSKKLAPDGKMIIQFLDKPGEPTPDAELRAYEPAVFWRKEKIEAMASLNDLDVEIKTKVIKGNILHHWCCFTGRQL